MTALPDGLYDLLVDARIRTLALELRDAGQIEGVSLGESCQSNGEAA